VQSHIPLKVNLAVHCPTYHVGREGILCAGETIIRSDSKGKYEVRERRFGYRTWG
jgi:hypothetical protein